MKSILKIYLKASERIFINGAVLRTDRKVALELLNDAHFLLEQHVIQADEADTPLKQLYYVVQLMVMAPRDSETVMPIFRASMAGLLAAFDNQRILAALKDIDVLVVEGSFYDALKAIRGLYPQELEILKAADVPVLADNALAAGQPKRAVG